MRYYYKLSFMVVKVVRLLLGWVGSCESPLYYYYYNYTRVARIIDFVLASLSRYIYRVVFGRVYKLCVGFSNDLGSLVNTIIGYSMIFGGVVILKPLG